MSTGVPHTLRVQHALAGAPQNIGVISTWRNRTPFLASWAHERKRCQLNKAQPAEELHPLQIDVEPKRIPKEVPLQSYLIALC